MRLPVAILAGGLATRLGPATERTPKAVLDVAGRPFIVRQLDHLREQGVTRVVLCVGHLGEQVEAVVGDGSTLGLDVRYSWDGPRLLGTGGALKKASPALGERFLVLYGDSYLPIDFRPVEQAFLSGDKPALMTVLRNADRWERSNVLFREGCILEYSKRAPRRDMAHIDYGLGALTASVLEHAPADEAFDLADVYHELSVRGLLAGYEVSERFYEIGTHSGLESAIEFFRQEGDA